MKPYTDRRAAGRVLGDSVAAEVRAQPGLLVLGLPRGGVPVAAEVAARLGAPLDVLVVRKLGVPGHEELAMGAIASGGAEFVDMSLVSRLRVSPEAVARVMRREHAELARRERAYRGDRPPLDLRSRTVVLVDDGLATGSSMRAAVEAVRAAGAPVIVVAVPVAPPEAVAKLSDVADAVICPLVPSWFHAVGSWYLNFEQTSDEEVEALLARPTRQ